MNGNCSLVALLGDNNVKPLLVESVVFVTVVLLDVRLDQVNAANGRVPVVLGDVADLAN